MDPPWLYYEHQVRERLKLWKRDFAKLLELGLIVPVGRDPPSGAPLFCAETIDHLATREQRERLRDALWWDFEPHPERAGRNGKRWIPPVDLPFYPFDSEEQQEWAHKLQKVMKKCAPFGHPNPSVVENFKKRAEDTATKAFQRAHGLARRRRNEIPIGRGHNPMTKAQLRDLVWSKTMIRAAADLGMSEFRLRKICKNAGFPTPPRGHFNHKDPTDRIPLPKLAGRRPSSSHPFPSGGADKCRPRPRNARPTTRSPPA